MKGFSFSGWGIGELSKEFVSNVMRLSKERDTGKFPFPDFNRAIQELP